MFALIILESHNILYYNHFFNLIELENSYTNYNLESKQNNTHSSKNDQKILLDDQKIKKMRLDSNDEKEFLNELIRFYDFNVKFKIF